MATLAEAIKVYLESLEPKKEFSGRSVAMFVGDDVQRVSHHLDKMVNAGTLTVRTVVNKSKPKDRPYKLYRVVA